MEKLSSSDKKDLAEHISWRKWGKENFGWKLYGSDGESKASFIVGGVIVDVTGKMREDIDMAVERKCKKM